MQLSDLTVEIRDVNRNRRGIIRPEDLNLQASIRHNNVGTWTLTLSTAHPLAQLLCDPGAGIIVTGPEDVLFSGPTAGPAYKASKDDPNGTLVIEGITDDIVLGDTLAWPEPGNIDPNGQTLTEDTRSGKAESVIHAYVNANCGPGAPSIRRKAGLVMGADLARGPEVVKSARFHTLGTFIADVATMAGLGFRVVQRGLDLVFETFEVSDKTDTIRLDMLNNTLSSHSVMVNPPTATKVIVAGATKGDADDPASRKFYLGSSDEGDFAESLWGRRIERLIDYRTTDNEDEYKQKADEMLAKEGFTAISVSLVPMSDTTMRFGRDWYLGDRVAAASDIGEYAAIATGMDLIADKDGVRVAASLGDGTALNEGYAVKRKLELTAQRVGDLERSVTGGPITQLVTNNNTVNDLGVPITFYSGIVPLANPGGYNNTPVGKSRVLTSLLLFSTTPGSHTLYLAMRRASDATLVVIGAWSVTGGNAPMSVSLDVVIPAGYGLGYGSNTTSLQMTASGREYNA